jgi:hypothetical protein
MAKQFIFEIPEADPHEIPMTRLLEYLTEVATILGNRKHVHFMRVEDAAASPVSWRLTKTDSTVPVHLLSEGIDFRCNASIDMARKLAHYLLQKPIRVYGRGKWYRNPNGKWSLDLFDIFSFEELEDASVPEIVSKLRAIPGNPLMSSDDPLEEMRRIRHGNDRV